MKKIQNKWVSLTTKEIIELNKKAKELNLIYTYVPKGKRKEVDSIAKSIISWLVTSAKDNKIYGTGMCSIPQYEALMNTIEGTETRQKEDMAALDELATELA